MERTIRTVSFSSSQMPRLKRVAAYARVSGEKDAAQHSLSAQVSVYSQMIQSQPGWTYCGVYADNGLTGTKETRIEFQRMMNACRNGELDLIITKSITRFARNTLTLLESVRELRRLGIDIFFEKENLHILDANGELILTILASIAQEESLSASENQLWRIRRNFEEGKPWSGKILGYRYCDGRYVIAPEEANIVRRIFSMYLEGNGVTLIAKTLNGENLMTKSGNKWRTSVITKILKNYNYTGNLLLQKTYRENHITKATKTNKGELPQFIATDTHEPIVSLATYQAVQAEFEKRASKSSHKPKPTEPYPFAHKIICANCGKYYRRKTTRTRVVWICTTYNTAGKKECASKAIPEGVLIAAATKLMGTESFDPIAFALTVRGIEAHNGNRLVFHFANEKTAEYVWQDRSRSESWTAEKREATRIATNERKERNG